jgi:hypothetical protein
MTVEAFHCISVVSCMADQYTIAGRLLPSGAIERITAAGRVYLFFRVDRRDKDLKFCDPSDGALLVEYKYFDTETAARDWVRKDAHTRGVQ